jgi:hypothetical protein
MIPRNTNAVLAIAFVSFLIVLLCSRAASAAPAAPGRAHAAAAKKKPRPPAPRQVSPAAGARTQGVPAFSWRRAKRAVRYQFQLSADPAFRSIVLGQRNGDYQTPNTFASISRAVADGEYFWRVRGIDKRDRVGRWSTVRSFTKAWTDAPRLTGPVEGAVVSYPATPLVLRWEPVPNAFKYLVRVATDPSLAHSALGDHARDIVTSGTVLALPFTLAPGRYYWAVTPLDAEKHPGARSAVASFEWMWPTATRSRVNDLNADARVFDPQFSWDPVPGAARYEVEVNPSEDFATGSRVCCDEAAYGTSLSPLRLLPNNTYFWRVRAIDVDGNAGAWNLGPVFRKAFDDVVPAIPRLRVRDSVEDKAPGTGPSGLPTTDSPVIAWDPVPGASSYQITLAPFDSPGFCNWTADHNRSITYTTATTAWAPLGFSAKRPLGPGAPPVAGSAWRMAAGGSYCVRVRARSDRDNKSREIFSDWTQLGGLGNPAFTYLQYDPGLCEPTSMPATAYRGPQSGTLASRTPLFTWERVPGACGYFVVVARDAAFTKVVDLAFTNNPAYAPLTATKPTTYADETTSYYWAVMPTAGTTGEGLATQPQEDHPQTFQKRSVPPVLVSPAPGADVTGQPAFRWGAAEGARSYRIQVATDPTFGDPIADVTTDATAYTSTSALPADTALYWRVRANDENRIGLTWSETRSFRRRLPVPVPALDNPLGGETIPVLQWSPIEGAVSYDMHVEQADGTKRDFTMRSTAFTPIVFFGTGVWHWQVRANFRSGLQLASGGFTPFVPFARRIATPAGLRTSKARGGILLSWEPTVMARQYRVEIATSDSFPTVVESVVTDNTSFAPKMMRPAYSSGAPLFWRVATLDEGHHLGGWATSPLRSSKRMRLRVRGKLRAGRSAVVRIRVTSAKGRGVKGVRVTLAGAGLRERSRRTGRHGTARFRVRPGSHGVVRLQADKRGFAPASARVKVR